MKFRDKESKKTCFDVPQFPINHNSKFWKGKFQKFLDLIAQPRQKRFGPFYVLLSAVSISFKTIFGFF